MPTRSAATSRRSHQYSLEEWGFDAAALREKMRPYTDYYGIELEVPV